MPNHPKDPTPPDVPIQGDDPGSNFDSASANGTEETPSYDVGYKKPPAEHRFKPGQSGNPRGGKPGPRKPTTVRILEEMGAVFIEPVEAKSGDKVVKLSRIVAATHATMQKAMKGDVPAMRVALDILARVQALPLPPDDRLMEEEEAAARLEIEAYLRRRLGPAEEKEGGQK